MDTGSPKDMLKELLGGKDLGRSNGAPHNSQEAIDSLLLVLAGQETCREQGDWRMYILERVDGQRTKAKCWGGFIQTTE